MRKEKGAPFFTVACITYDGLGKRYRAINRCCSSPSEEMKKKKGTPSLPKVYLFFPVSCITYTTFWVEGIILAELFICCM